MEFLSSKEIAEKWNISSRRVVVLASQGKIKGAQKISKIWMIPSDAKKPIDGRTKQLPFEDSYRFPLVAFGNYSQEEISGFPKDEQELYRAYYLYCNYEMEEANKILIRLLDKTKNIYIRIGTLSMLCYTYWHTGKIDKAANSLLLLREIFEEDFQYKGELKFVLWDAISVLEGLKVFSLPMEFDMAKNYSDTGKAFITQFLTCRTLTLMVEEKTPADPVIYELICDKLESENYHIIAMYMHIYIGGMWQLTNDFEKAQKHYEKAIEVAVEHKLYVPLLELCYLSYSFIEPIIKKLPAEERNHFQRLHKKLNEDTEALITKTEKETIANKNLSDEELKFINYILCDFQNKKIAQIEKMAESTINKKLTTIYEKLNISGKKELFELVISSWYEKQ